MKRHNLQLFLTAALLVFAALIFDRLLLAALGM
jgi:hypothetical protein